MARTYGKRFTEIQPANTLVQAHLIGEEYQVEMEAEAVIEKTAGTESIPKTI